jgi:putative tricarboxylic transport membrane protein
MELLLAIGVVIFGLLVVWQTTHIRVTPAYAKVGPRVIPYIVGSGLVLIGIWVAVEALTGRGSAPTSESEDADPTLPTDWRTVGMIAVALVAYLLLIERAGFVIASTLLYAGSATAMGSRKIAQNLAIGLVFSTLIFAGFTRGLDLRLPAGIFEGWFA